MPGILAGIGKPQVAFGLWKDTTMQMQKRWWLGFLGFIGIYKLPDVMAALNGQASAWEYIYLSWLIWLLYFVPETAPKHDAAAQDKQ